MADERSTSGMPPPHSQNDVPKDKAKAVRHELAGSDLEFVRVLEDLIDVLIEKRVIMLTDLPPAARRKLSLRSNLRDRLSDLTDIVGDNEEDVFLP